MHRISGANHENFIPDIRNLANQYPVCINKYINKVMHLPLESGVAKPPGSTSVLSDFLA